MASAERQALRAGEVDADCVTAEEGQQLKEAFRRAVPAFAWGSVFTALATVVLRFGVTILALGAHPRWLWWPLASAVCAWAVLPAYAALHECIHYNISGPRRHLRWIDTLIGNILSIFVLSSFHFQKVTHLAHHRHTNLEGDLQCGRCPSAPRQMLRLFKFLNLLILLPFLRRGQGKRNLLYQVLVSASFYAACLSGYWLEAIVFYAIPTTLGYCLVWLFFVHLPHVPFAPGRWANTRVFDSWWLKILTFDGSGYHLLHHLHPPVPFYRQRAAFEELRPLLERKGVRIETTGWPPRSRRMPKSR